MLESRIYPVLASILLAACGQGADGAKGDDDAAPPTESEPSTDDDGVTDDTREDDDAQFCTGPSPGPAPLRRLSNAEYRNTLVDLVQDVDLVDQVVSGLPREPTSLGFRTAASALTITPLIADHYLAAAEQLGRAVIQGGLVDCDLDAPEPSCLQDFVENFGARVYRRPLSREELVAYSELYDAALLRTPTAAEALAWVVGTMFASPHFLFRVELSASDAVARPDAFEMASRLSYLLWQTMPDEELFEAARSGELETEEGIESQVRRMMGEPEAFRVYEFFSQWLDIDEAESLSRDEGAYPEYDVNLRRLLETESEAFVKHLLVNDGTFADLLTADYTFANAALAQHYELPEPPEGSRFVRVSAPDRAGVLTQMSLLIHDRPSRTSIVKRGLKIRTDFLCQIVPAPPDNVDFTLPELSGDVSQAERLQQHRTDPSCNGCHALMDPIGEIFEGFGPTGKSRSVDEGGVGIVSGGSVTGTRSLNGDYANPRELAVAMSTDEQVRECFALQAFRFFYGRDASDEDSCTRQQLMAAFERNDYRLLDLVLGLTRSDQFLYRAPAQTEVK